MDTLTDAQRAAVRLIYCNTASLARAEAVGTIVPPEAVSAVMADLGAAREPLPPTPAESDMPHPASQQGSGAAAPPRA